MLNNLPLQTRLVAALGIPAVAATAASVPAVALGDGTVRAVGVGCVVLVVIGTVLALLIIRSIVQRLGEVTVSAESLARERLPRLVDSTTTEADLAAMKDFDGEADDELGRVVKALNTVQSTTAGLSVRQHEQIREGLGELVVNLVRRNQSLLKRQIEHIDDLESSEEDPERLKGLFGVDHLATRMRRNSESLLVLAGAEPPRRRGAPISIANLMRVAMSEIEGYQQVHLADVDHGEVSAQVAFDLAHLTSELMENATHFSPPTAKVEVAGTVDDYGDYVLSVTDRGIGMSEVQIDEANLLLAEPPELNLNLGRSLGFIVVSRLARRLDIAVRLVPTAGGAGVTSLVTIPASLLAAAALADGSGVDDELLQADDPTDMPGAIPDTATYDNDGPTSATDTEPGEEADGHGVRLTSLESDSGWQPPTLPERVSGGLGQRQASESPAAPIKSEALDRLLGMAAPTRKAPTNPDRSEDSAFPVTAGAPTGLEEAIPTGEDFDAGVASLLDQSDDDVAANGIDTPKKDEESPPADMTKSGLVKRDRSKSFAPTNEGRVIPDASRAAAASTRDPQEIRDMLARYREARSSVTTADAATTTDAAKTATDPNNESEGQA